MKLSLADRVARAREQADITQAALADAAGLSQSAVSQVERGHRKTPSAFVLLRIASALQMDPYDLLPEGRIT